MPEQIGPNEAQQCKNEKFAVLYKADIPLRSHAITIYKKNNSHDQAMPTWHASYVMISPLCLVLFGDIAPSSFLSEHIDHLQTL